jgi:flagellar hook-associated protein 1 FlgK
MSSVSTDEELTDMLRFQRAYDAAARVITTVDEMLDRLINHTGLVGR